MRALTEPCAEHGAREQRSVRSDSRGVAKQSHCAEVQIEAYELHCFCFSGPWNSWDRVPYITTLRNGSASTVPADRHIHHNFVIANYNSEGAIDTDDGSAYYLVYDNFFACVALLCCMVTASTHGRAI